MRPAAGRLEKIGKGKKGSPFSRKACEKREKAHRRPHAPGYKVWGKVEGKPFFNPLSPDKAEGETRSTLFGKTGGGSEKEKG